MQSVSRLLNIMEILANSSGMRIRDIVEKTKLNKSTVYRFLQALSEKGYVYHNTNTEYYYLSFKVVRLSHLLLNNFSIAQLAKEPIISLGKKVQETIHLTMFNNDSIVYLDKFTGNDNGITISSYIGKTQPLYSTASGKLFLSFLNQEEFEDIWQKITIEEKTPYTIIDKQKMLEELELVRNQRYAIDFQENEENIVCIACPVYDFADKITYAISITLPILNIEVDKIKNKLINFLPDLQATCKEVSKL